MLQNVLKNFSMQNVGVFQTGLSLKVVFFFNVFLCYAACCGEPRACGRAGARAAVWRTLPHVNNAARLNHNFGQSGSSTPALGAVEQVIRVRIQVFVHKLPTVLVTDF